ncbi:diguanylate cyclase [Halomonas sp. McH1-25]|uniref:diguanylate cyclase n=1 Tax=unclassified Halomonas TaxID=2609666 RepID=UPI001EF4A267|nr:MULTISPECIES: diguanylate cyclase [unclassified Halomonas]MCG7602103.1 diguanylate cyclase [Halomonas sp. McH1-25]MCP1343021.1 diguanylate cyclase [Halomonas sp. FL8]MCP1362443.1 diguanylate cyclase [Halomonas sp. BBD45]MCP1365639.1 diguanylate cyclase [Halomonas sp. BBD48]
MDTHALLITVLLYVFLPLWGVAGFVDWCCHRASKIEATSGLKESLIHSLMGIQIAIPILFCLVYRVNVLVLLVCLVAWVLHEVAAHLDLHVATPQREISVWEMHAHTYLGSLPLYMLAMIFVINWPVVLDLVSLDWQGQMTLEPIRAPHGGEDYLPFYLTFMGVLCVAPYAEENLRCLRQALTKRGVWL